MFNTGRHSLWRKLIGDPEKFSERNRSINALSIITLILLLVILPLNILSGLKVSTYINVILIALQFFVYYLSRAHGMYAFATVIYAIASYGAIIINYIYNSGSTGPTLFLFFLTFHLLIAITRRMLHIVWALCHIVISASLILVEYTHPGWISGNYTSPGERHIDILGTYIVSLAFVYIITNYLLARYNREKRIAEEHAKAIQEQNEKLKEIAWLQSHKVRSHVTTIMGLAQLFNEKDSSDPANIKVMQGINSTAHQLDDAIRDINALTTDVLPSQEGLRQTD